MCRTKLFAGVGMLIGSAASLAAFFAASSKGKRSRVPGFLAAGLGSAGALFTFKGLSEKGGALELDDALYGFDDDAVCDIQCSIFCDDV